MTTTIQIRKKGQITIPVDIRERFKLEENDVVTITTLDNGAILVIPRKLKLPELLDKTADMAKKKGITLEEMLAELDEIRHNS